MEKEKQSLVFHITKMIISKTYMQSCGKRRYNQHALLAPLLFQQRRYYSKLIAPLFEIDSAASILTTFKRSSNRQFYFLTKYFFLNITVNTDWRNTCRPGIKHVQPLLQLLGILPSYSLSFVKICIQTVACVVKQLVQVQKLY